MNKPTPQGIAVFHDYIKQREKPSTNYNRHQPYTELLKFIQQNIQHYDSAIISLFVMLIALSEHKAINDKDLERFCADMMPVYKRVLDSLTLLHTLKSMSDTQFPNTPDPIDPFKN